MTKLFEVYDSRFLNLLLPNSKLEHLAWGARWAEGPVWFSEGNYLLWSDIPNNRILYWSASEGMRVYREPSNFSNGHYRDLQGRLVSCEHGRRCVSRTEPDGTVNILVDRYQGKRLNSPNDVVVKSDGTIWFTDPPYGIMQPDEGYFGLCEVGGYFVYRFDPETNDLSIVARDSEKPNGLAFSPDEKILYVADSALSHDPFGNHQIRAYDVMEGKQLTNSRIFAVISPGNPYGLRVDHHGYLYITAHDGIQVYSPAGELLGKIMVPEVVANCTFGGSNKDRLFIAATKSIYAIYLNTTGVQKP